MNTFVILIVLIIGIIIYTNKKNINLGLLNDNNMVIEKFNNYTILYLLHLLHTVLTKKDLWYIIIGDTLDSIAKYDQIPVFSNVGYILMNKSDEEKILGLENNLKEMNLVMRKNINSIEISTNFNKNIHIMIYLVDNNNGMLDVCTTNEQLECKQKCCKLEGSNINIDKFKISYGDANPRMLYTVDNVELYGPNNYKEKKKAGCEPKKRIDIYNKRDKILLNQYINEIAGRTNTNIIHSTAHSTKGMNKIPPLGKVSGYNIYNYKH